MQKRLGILLTQEGVTTIAMLGLLSACGKLPGTSTNVTSIPEIAGAVGSTTTATTTGRVAAPQAAVSSATAGGMFLHTTAQTANEAVMDAVDTSIKYSYRYALNFMAVSKAFDMNTCILNALQSASLITFNDTTQYFRNASSVDFRVKVKANSDGGIEAYEVASCTGATQTLWLKGAITSGTIAGQYKYNNGTAHMYISFLGAVTTAGAFSSKVLDAAYISGTTGTDIAYRMNLTQTSALLKINGVSVSPTSTSTLSNASMAIMNFYGSKYTSDSATGYGFGGGSVRYTTNGTSYSTAHWKDTGATTTTTTYATDVANGTTYPATGYTSYISNSTFSTETGSTETWDCSIGTATRVDLTDAATLAKVSAAVTACTAN